MSDTPLPLTTAQSERALPAPPKPALSSPLSVKALFVWNDVRGRSAFAIRASLCTAIPLLIGWLLGNEGAGLIASIGAFTGLYGEQLPYHKRAVLLAVTALAFVLAITLGELGTVTPFLGVVTVSIFAGVAVLIYNSLNVGRPGAYLLVMVCAMGTMIQSRGISITASLLLVLGGGLCAWCVQMVGYLIVPYGPQRRIILAAARAVQSLVKAMGKPTEDMSRHIAAAALQDAWEMLAGLPPENPFQKLNRRINLVFSSTTRRDTAGDKLLSVCDALVREARRLSPRKPRKDAESGDLLDQMNRRYVDEQLTNQHRRALDMLKEGIVGPYSAPRRSAIRIAIASFLAGIIGLYLGLTQAYWAMAAAALVLHQSGGRTMLIQRGWQRLVGTLVGLATAELVIWIHPQGFWLVLVMTLCRYLTEMTIMRNYALAVIFITPSSLLIASTFTEAVGALFFARAIDTLVGVACAALVLFTVATKDGERRVPKEILQTLDAAEALLNQLTTGDMYSRKVRRLQDRLRRRLISLRNAYDDAMNESKTIEKHVSSYWANVVRAQRLGYRILALGWTAREGASLNFGRMRQMIALERARYQESDELFAQK
ncbi:MAG: FUSC family protein [Burkholderiales bacterium]|jgi:uncharacterized membrane protein YccC|nr:FUSC family protein [Burkholderiales bacterium]